MGIELKKITWDNYKDFLDLEVEESQKKYVASPQFGITEAYLNQIQGCCTTEILGIYKNSVMAGHVVIQLWKKESRTWYDIHRFMLDRHFQGNGNGSAAFEKVMEYVRTNPMGQASFAVIEFMPENAKAAHIYHSHGFKDTDEFNRYGEQKAVLRL